MFGKIVGDTGCAFGALFALDAPGPGMIDYDVVWGRPGSGIVTEEDSGDLLDE